MPLLPLPPLLEVRVHTAFPSTQGRGGEQPGRGPREEQVRAAHAELRELAQAVDDPALRSRLHAVCRRLAAAEDAPADLPAPRLAPRELDVLAEVALGRTNAEVGDRLGVFPETVKAYLRSAMRKLQAHTRYEAVVTARRCGLLP